MDAPRRGGNEEQTVSIANDIPRVSAARSHFFLSMSVACLVVALLSFSPTYFVPLASGTLQANAAVHLHGAVFYSWALLFVVQSWLATHGGMQRHRALGQLGIALATLMCVAAVIAGVNLSKRIAAAGAPTFIQEVTVGAVALDIGIFAALFTAAIVYVRNTEAHRRLMLIATVAVLGAALNRVYLVLANELSLAVRQQFNIELPILTADLLLVPLLIHDLRSRGRPHPATLWGAGALLVLHLVRVPLYGSALSATLGRGLLAFTG
jgi:hypothetical protein